MILNRKKHATTVRPYVQITVIERAPGCKKVQSTGLYRETCEPDGY